MIKNFAERLAHRLGPYKPQLGKLTLSVFRHDSGSN